MKASFVLGLLFFAGLVSAIQITSPVVNGQGYATVGVKPYFAWSDGSPAATSYTVCIKQDAFTLDLWKKIFYFNGASKCVVVPASTHSVQLSSAFWDSHFTEYAVSPKMIQAGVCDNLNNCALIKLEKSTWVVLPNWYLNLASYPDNLPSYAIHSAPFSVSWFSVKDASSYRIELTYPSGFSQNLVWSGTVLDLNPYWNVMPAGVYKMCFYSMYGNDVFYANVPGFYWKPNCFWFKKTLG